MQELHEYLKDRSKKDFAQQVGIVPAYLSQILSTKKTPSFPLMVRIEKATGGEVPVSAWMPKDEVSA